MGDTHRIPRCMDKKYSDPEFAGLLLIDPCKLNHNLSPFYTRPAYAYTKAAVGGLYNEISDL